MGLASLILISNHYQFVIDILSVLTEGFKVRYVKQSEQQGIDNKRIKKVIAVIMIKININTETSLIRSRCDLQGRKGV